ncbi:element excision factor XisH family protein [Microseira sp. BLCC-F43]
MAAEKVFAAEKAGRKIAFEVKSFLNSSAITDFHSALGQFLNYRLALQMSDMMSWKSPIIKTLRVSLSPRLCVSPNYG